MNEENDLEQEVQEFMWSEFAIQRELETLKTMVTTIYYIKKGYMPVFEETKKAAQIATKELCAAIIQFVNED